MILFQVRLSSSGIIETRSASLFGGYWRNAAKTKEDFTDDGWFITGDIGRIDERGSILSVMKCSEKTCTEYASYRKETDLVEEIH